MSKSAKRKQMFILTLFAILGLGVAFLAFRDIPVQPSEQTVQIDAANTLK